MYLGSDEFNNAIENTQGNAPKIRVTLANGEILSNIKSIKYYGGSNNSDDISIGTTNMARIDVTVLTDKMLTNNEIFLEQGVELANGVVEYMPIGYFVAQKPQGDIDEVKFTAYDRMQKFEKPYSSSLTYPTTSALILDELCQICGVELATPIDNAIEVTENLKGYTCREVLGYIASMHSSFACIDRYGKLNLRWYSDTPIEKKLNKIWSFEKSQDNFEIAKVEIAKDSETNYVSGDGITTLYNSNPLATQEIADDVFAKLGGFNYSVGEIEMLDDARLDAWDMVSVTYYDGKTYNIPCMTLEHDFKAYSTTVKSVGKSESENEYKFTGPTIQYLNRMATDLLVTNRVVATKVDAEYVKSHAITTDNLDAITAQIQELVVEEIDGKYANIELANIDVANINVGKIAKLFAKVGLIDRATIVEGHITGFLDAVEVNANKITAGTLIADRILLSGGDKGILYALNNLGELTSTNVDSLDGYVLTDRTINADKIIAESITANELDVNQIFGNKAVLNKLVSQEIFSDAVSTNTVVVGANATAKNALDLATSTGLSTGNQILIIDGAESELIDFKAYGRSTQDGTPTPDAPVDIVSVGESGALEIKSTGKNLFDETLRFGRTAVGITTNVNSKKNGVINGTLTQNSLILNWHTTAPIDILGLSVGQSLTISYKRVSGTYNPNNTNTNAKFYCDVLDENKTAISKYQLLVCTLNNNEGKATFTMTQQMKDDNVSYLYPQIWAYVNDKFDNLEMQIQIEHGTNVTEYEPHKSSTVSIPLTEPLRSMGDVRDEIACVDGIYGIIRRIGVSVFDGVNNKCNAVGTGGLNHPYGISFTSGNGYNDIDNKAVKIVSGNHRDLISDYFSRDKVVYYADTTTQDLGSGIYRTANGVWLSITRKIADANNITSIEAFNTWLQNNNVTVQYILAEEMFEPFDDQELIRIRLYNNTTYITNSDNAEMWVEYYKNNLTGIQLANINGIGQSNNRLLANWASDNDITLIDGAKIYTGSITAKSIDIEDLFADTGFINALSANSIIVGANTNAQNALNSVNSLKIGGTNLLIRTKTVGTYLNTTSGELKNPNATYSPTMTGDITSDWIDVSLHDNVTITLYDTFTDTTHSGRYCLYDSSKNVLSTTAFNPRSPESVIVDTSNASYMRITAISCLTYRYKVEKGNKATDWSPAPEDIDADINLVENIANTTQNTLNGLTKLDGDVTVIDGGKIYTRSILANSLAIGDFTNLAVANPDDYNPNGYATIEDDNGFKWFEFGSDDKLGYYSIVLNEFPIATTFNKGDQYLLRCLVYASQPTSIRICLRGLYEASGYINLASAFYDNVTTEQQFIEIPFKVNSLPNAKITRYSLFFETRNTKLGILYVREISVHQMTNGVLIANGSITANKIDVNDLFAQEITATGTITGATIIGSIFENDWDETSRTGLSIKNDLIRIGHKTSGQQAYYPYMEIGQGRINLTHYPRGVQDLPFVNISPYGIQAGIQKADMRVNTTLDFSADTGGMTLSGNFVAGKITTVAGADLDSIDKTVSHPLREYCDCSLFAQAIIDSYVSDVSIYGAQSMAMANINGTDYVLVLFTTSTTANNADVAVLYTLDGQVVRYKTGLKLGHCNGVTFNTKDSQFYVACAGGDNGINQVAVLTSELKIPKTYSLAGKEVQGIYGIAYNKDRETFYVVGSKNSIAEVSTDFSTVLQKSTLQVKNDEYAPQSIFYDGTYISFAYNVDGSSYCDLYEPEDLSFVSMQFINNFGELEGGYYHKDELYLLVNTSNSGLILKSSQYLDGKVFDFWNERHLSDRIQTSDTIHELYFNSTATNFLLDGTLNKPFRKLYYGWSYMVGQSLKNIRMNLIGDFSKYNINIKKYLGTLYIRGYNSTKVKLGGIYLRNFGNVSISYLTITKANDIESALVSLYYGQRCTIAYVDFNGTGTENMSLRVLGGICDTSNCAFISNSTYSIYCTLGGIVTTNTSNTYIGTGTIQSSQDSMISLSYRTPMNTLQEEYKNEVIIGGENYGTINLAQITREGKYRIEGLSTVTNCPTVLSTGQFCVDIVRYDYCIEYNVITYRGIPYKGVLGENSTEIKWYSLTAL